MNLERNIILIGKRLVLKEGYLGNKSKVFNHEKSETLPDNRELILDLVMSFSLMDIPQRRKVCPSIGEKVNKKPNRFEGSFPVLTKIQFGTKDPKVSSGSLNVA